MRFRANLTSVTNPRIEVHALLSRFHPSWKGLVEGTCRHRAGLQHRCSACEKLELCITSDKYNLFYQTSWFLRINLGVFRRLVNFVPNKRFKRNQTYPQRRFVPRKRFRWNKVGPVTQNFDQPRNVGFKVCSCWWNTGQTINLSNKFIDGFENIVKYA